MAPGKLPGGVLAPSLPAGIQNLSPIKCLIGIIGLLTDAHGERFLREWLKYNIEKNQVSTSAARNIPCIPVPFLVVNEHHSLQLPGKKNYIFIRQMRASVQRS